MDPTIKQLSCRSTWSEQTRMQAQKWIRECRDRHDICHSTFPEPNSESARLPTRLLDIGKSSDSHVRLVSSTGLPHDTNYMTLSHCWGELSSFLLTKDTLPSFMSQINTAELSPTFSNAIQVTRELDIQYLWIDALCIIQDSEDDWRRECATMHEVYSNSYCTIAAATSKNSEGGLFYKRDPLAATPCKVQCSWNVNQSESFMCYDDKPWINVEFGSLYSRAWVLQERLLSPCMLLFADDQVYWECSELIASESCPSGLPSVLRLLKSTWSSALHSLPPPSEPLILAAKAEPSSRKSSIAGDSRVPMRLMEAWDRIVFAYSCGKLTFESDKLIAFSGLAHQFSKVLNAPAKDYLGGLWRSDLEKQLLWSTYADQGKFNQVRAPSWSRSSIDAWIIPASRVIYDTHVHSWSSCIQILEASTMPIADPFGPVSGGCLVIRGQLCRIECPEELVKDPHWWRNADSLVVEKEAKRTVDDTYCTWSIDTLDPENVEVVSVYLMPFAVYCYSRENSQPRESSNPGTGISPNRETVLEDYICGLMLAKTLAAKGQYRRIGTFMVKHKVVKAILREPTNTHTLPKDRYLDFDGGKDYTIEIV
jgi:Heterokaryon incompatibility protein (HET)